MRPFPVPCHRGVLNPHAITRQLCLTSAQLLPAPPSRRSIHHTAPLCKNTRSDYVPEARKPRTSELAEPTSPWPEREPPNEADKPNTSEPDQVEQRRVVYNKDGHEPSIHRYMSSPNDRIPSSLPLRYSLSDSGGWARKLRSPKEAPVREEAAPPEEPYSADPLMMFYNKISPARGQEKSDPAAVESESRLETGGIEAEARSREAELLSTKEQQLKERERNLEALERRLNALVLKLEGKSEGKEQGEAGVGETPGRQGEMGVKAAPGRPGEMGVRAAPGRQGEMGARVAPGRQGEMGVRAAPGRQVEAGVRETPNRQGEMGVGAAPGRQVEAGVRVAPGRQGEAGVRGTPGRQGEAGFREAPGRQGEASVREAPGQQGEAGVRETSVPPMAQLHWAAVKKARLAQEARLRDVPANIEVPYEELKALHERGPLAAHKRVMILASFKRQQLEYDVVENPASEKQWPRRADTELRSWVINHKLHQFLYRNLREERRRVDIMNRQRLVARKKLRISPDLPDPVAEVEARVHQFIVQRDAQAIVRKSKEFTRKNHRRLVLAERAGLHALIAQGLPEVGDVRRGRIIAGLRRKEERVARINAKKQRKALKQAIQKSEGSSG